MTTHKMIKGGENLRRFLILLILLTSFLMFSCTSPVHDDLKCYISVKLPPITELENSALNEFKEIVSKENYTYQSLYDSLTANIIPKYLQFIKELEGITVKTEELKKIHDIYIIGARKQLEVFINLKEGIEEKNKEKIILTNDLLREAKNYISRYNEEVIKLADKYDINYNLE